MGVCYSKKKEGAVPAQQDVASPQEVVPEVKQDGPSRFYIVEHAVKDGQTEAFWSELSAMMSDQEAYTKIIEKQKAKGLKNHGFFPITATKIFCTWEVLDGYNEKVLQEYLDKDVSMPIHKCTNACVRVNRNMNPDPKVLDATISKAVPYSADGKAMADQDVYKKMLERHAELKMVNHSFMPLNEHQIICTWEVDESVENPAEQLQNYLDQELSTVNGTLVLSNECMRIDTSKNPKPFERDDSQDGSASASSTAATDAEETIKPEEEQPCVFGSFPSTERRFFVVEHTALPGKEGDLWEGLGAMMADQEKYAAMTEEQKSKGLINREFMPTGTDGSKIFCTWEVEAGTDDQVLQDYLDNSDMPTKFCTNALFPMSTELNPDTGVLRASSSESVPFSEQGQNACFVVKHTVRCDDKHAMRKSWWGQLGAVFADENLMKSMLASQAELKMLNHSFMPVNEDFMICTWEVDASVENPAQVLQKYLDGTLCNVDGVQTLSNEVIRIDTTKNPGCFKREIAVAEVAVA